SAATRDGSEGVELAWICQGAGSALFGLLFLRSGYLPRALAAFQIFAGVLLIVISAAMFVDPQYIGPLKLAGIPGLLADVATAIWLLKGPRRPERHPLAPMMAPSEGGS